MRYKIGDTVRFDPPLRDGTDIATIVGISFGENGYVIPYQYGWSKNGSDRFIEFDTRYENEKLWWVVETRPVDTVCAQCHQHHD